jgi:hypothetical protein
MDMAGSVDVCCGCEAYPLGFGIGKKLDACLAPMLIVNERFFDDWAWLTKFLGLSGRWK